ncbi:MAG: hypothetical protein ABJA57_01535 [Ginsengibacter sp.]
MQDQRPMSEVESLEIITGMINQARNRISETGRLYLVWGWMIFICCLVQFILLYFFNNHQAYYIWYITWLGLVYQVYYIVKKKKRQNVRTYSDELIGFVWLTFVICSFIIVYILIKNQAMTAINPCVLVLYGIPTFLSGIILKFKALSTGGLICWLLAVVAMFTSYEFQLLLLSLAVACAWIIPGYLLRSRFKKQNQDGRKEIF